MHPRLAIMTTVAALLAASTALASRQEDPDSSLRQVCADEGTKLYASPRASTPSAALPRNTFVRILASETVQGQAYLKVSTLDGQIGFIPGATHNLCYATFTERRICDEAGSVSVLTAPGGGQVAGTLGEGELFRYFGVVRGDYTLVRYARSGGWREAWLPRERVCDVLPQPEDTEVPLRRVCQGRGTTMYDAPASNARPLATLDYGSFVLLQQRTGDYLEVSHQGQRGYLRASEHGLCYATYSQRRACLPQGGTGTVPARWLPRADSEVAASLRPGHRLRFYGMTASEHAYVRYRHAGSWKTGWISGDSICLLPRGSDRSAGAQVLELFYAGSVELADTTSGRNDGADPLSNITAAADGLPARRSVHGSSPGGNTYLQNSLLLALLALVSDYGMSLDISHIAGGEHSTDSYHYHGRAVDIRAVNGRGIWGVSAEATALRSACVALGAVEALGPDNAADHQDHVHCAF